MLKSNSRDIAIFLQLADRSGGKEYGNGEAITENGENWPDEIVLVDLIIGILCQWSCIEFF